MQRRKFLLATGSLAAGSAAAVGTGAFSAMEASREANISVVNDSSGLIALQSGTNSDIVREENGELVIDFTADGQAGGVNKDSIYQVGYFGTYEWMGPEDQIYPPKSATAGDPYELPAFSIINQDTTPHAVTVSFDFAGEPGNSKMYIMGSSRSAETVDSASNIPKRSEWFPGGDGEFSFEDYGDVGQPGDIRLESGGRIGVSIFIDTRSGSTSDDLSGTLTISST